jgi:pyruvate/2-oxoglutarate dehydrogenase complex dihydrolipoamide acyltransferase (E2) component
MSAVAPAAIRPGRYALVRPTLGRQLAMDAFAALQGGHPMVAVLEFDATDAVGAIDRLKQQGERVSLFAFVVRQIAIAIAEHPDLNLVRHGRRLVRFEDVDVCIPVEVSTPDGPYPRDVVIRRAQDRTVGEIYAQIEAARERHGRSGELGEEDRWVHRTQRVLQWLPRWVRIPLLRLIIRSGFRIKDHAGTTLVSSVAKFASIPGAAFTFITGPRAAAFVVGGVAEQPWVHGGTVVPRKVLSLSVIVDHDLVDGAPVARFAARLQCLIESGKVRPCSREP